MRLRFGALALLGAMLPLALSATTASAQAYPDKPVRIVVPYAPGGATDNYARMLAQRLSDDLGQQFVVENRAGASAAIGVGAVARSPADGYTLLFGAGSSFSISPLITKDLGYKPEDLAPISMILRNPFALTVRTGFPHQTLPEIIDYAKKNPGKVSIASLGSGTGPYLLGRMLQSAAGIKLLEVPFKGAAPVALEMKADRIDLYADGLTGARDMERNGISKIIAVMDSQRWPPMPNVPSSAELGFPDMALSTYFVLFAPAGTPQPVLDKLHKAVAAVVDSDAFKSKVAEQGSIAQSSTPDEVKKLISAESARIKKIVDEAGIQPQ